MPSSFSSAFAAIGPVVQRLRRMLLERQRADGCWCEPPASDVASVADVLLLLDFTGRDHDSRREPFSRWLLARQLPDGGWSAQVEGASDLNTTIRAYLALTNGDLDANASPLEHARGRLAAWGAARCDGATRLRLALFGQLPHLDDETNNSSASIAEVHALQLIDAYKPVRPRPRDPVLSHLFRDDVCFVVGRTWNPLRRWNARRATQQLCRQLLDGFYGEGDGPTSVLPLMALHGVGLGPDDPAVRAGWEALDARIEHEDGMACVVPHLAPLRDTALAMLGLHDVGVPACAPSMRSAAEWTWARLLRAQARGGLPIADAALALLALARTGHAFHGERPGLIESMLDGMFDEQSDEGDWGNPETTGLMLEVLGVLGARVDEPIIADAVVYLEAAQEPDSGWSGVDTWQATWRVLAGLRSVGHEPHSLMMRRAVAWLQRTQHMGGGWGETPDQSTAPALLALMAAGEASSSEADAGVNRLLATGSGDPFSLMALGQYGRCVSGLTCVLEPPP